MTRKVNYRFVIWVLSFKKWFYKAASTNYNICGNFQAIQPVLLKGKGRISFGEKVRLGVVDSPTFYNTYAYLEARTQNAQLIFGNHITVNNQFSAVAELSIIIGDHVLIGLNCHVSDSNFHDLQPDRRHQTDPDPMPVVIGKNVFIGNNVTILKGVEIGENSIIAAGSTVTKSFPANVIIGGFPAKIIKELH